MSSSKFFESCSITKSSESSGGSKPTEVLSDFGDGSCGEPAFAQHLVLDFTPDAEIDNEISQKKICDFWKFINSTPEIKNLMVKPFSNTTRKLSSSGTSNPKPLETFSVFGEEACGEPLLAQHVVIDFTPNAEDKECIQKKVCSFWKFINSIPDIQNLKVQPEKNVFTGDSKTDVAPESVKSEVSELEVGNVVDTGLGKAVHMLGFAEEKNLINTLFEAKLPQSMCTLGSREYKQSEVVPQPKKKDKKKHVCKCIPCRNPKCRNKMAANSSSEELSPLRTLSRKMNEWDAKHPKSMEPPGHPPTLQHCLIQRQMFPAPLDSIPSRSFHF